MSAKLESGRIHRIRCFRKIPEVVAVLEIETALDHLPIFPLPGCLLLPRTNLPLHVFEPRYRLMIQEAIEDAKLIGMIQPKVIEYPETMPQLYSTGCLGRLTSHQETQDGHFYIVLTGVCRFSIRQELPLTDSGYRVIVPDFEPFMDDLCPQNHRKLNRKPLLEQLRKFAKSRSFNIAWDLIEQAKDEEFVNAICMGAPFDPGDKQVLLEAAGLIQRAQLLKALFEIELASPDFEPTWLQ